MASTCDRKMDRKAVMIDHRIQVTKGGGGRQERLLDGSRRGGRTGGPDVAEWLQWDAWACTLDGEEVAQSVDW